MTNGKKLSIKMEVVSPPLNTVYLGSINNKQVKYFKNCGIVYYIKNEINWNKID